VSLFLPAFPDAGGLLFVAIYADFIMAVNKEASFIPTHHSQFPAG
jgi:hypothetical protein